MDKLILVDGNAVTMASFKALGNLATADGQLTGGIYGFVTTLLKLLDDFPTHIGVVFDKGKSDKCNIAAFYKANRGERPAELDAQYAAIAEFLKIMRIPAFSNLGYEADDIIATFATHFKDEIPVEVATRDKDLFYLCGYDNVTVRYFSYGGGRSKVEVMDSKKVFEKMGVEPFQIEDLKAIAGDSSDNIPGIMGIGDKTAVKLLNEYGTAEEIYNNLEHLSPSVAKKFTEGRPMFDVCKKLVHLEIHNTAIPVDVFARRTSDWEEMKTFFRKYEFNSLIDN